MPISAAKVGPTVKILYVAVVVQEMSAFIEESTYVDGVVNLTTVVVNGPQSYWDADFEYESNQRGVGELADASTEVEKVGCAFAVIVAVLQGFKIVTTRVSEAVGAEAEGTTL